MSFPPPPPLDCDEYRRRWHKLNAEGKPTTMANIDPDFYAWCERSRQSLRIRIGIAIVAFVLFLAFFAVSLASRAGGH